MLLPYTITYTDPSDPTKPSFQIQPGQIDTTSTNLALPGKGRVDYGELYNDNLVHLLEHFSATTPPSHPTRGQLWYDSGNKALMVYDPANIGSGWLRVMTTGSTDRFQIPVVTALPTLDLSPGDIVYLSGVEKIHVCVTLPDSTKQWLAVATQEWCETQLVIECGTFAFS